MGTGGMGMVVAGGLDEVGWVSPYIGNHGMMAGRFLNGTDFFPRNSRDEGRDHYGRLGRDMN